MSEALGLNSAWLMGFDIEDSPNLLPVSLLKIPLLGEIACYLPIIANQVYEYIDVDDEIIADFALVARGDSMIGARIYDGDYVFIKKTPIVENGEIAAVIIDDEATLKRFYKDGDKVILTAENPRYPPLIYEKEEIDKLNVLGRVTFFQGKL